MELYFTGKTLADVVTDVVMNKEIKYSQKRQEIKNEIEEILYSDLKEYVSNDIIRGAIIEGKEPPVCTDEVIKNFSMYQEKYMFLLNIALEIAEGITKKEMSIKRKLSPDKKEDNRILYAISYKSDGVDCAKTESYGDSCNQSDWDFPERSHVVAYLNDNESAFYVA